MAPQIFRLMVLAPPRFHSTCHGSIQTYTNCSDINLLDANLTWLASYSINSFDELASLVKFEKSCGILHLFSKTAVMYVWCKEG